jgi:hypothetical protein
MIGDRFHLRKMDSALQEERTSSNKLLIINNVEKN